MAPWKIENQLDSFFPGGTTHLSFDPGTGNITALPGSSVWGKVTSKNTAVTPAFYIGQEVPVGPTKRDFTIWQAGKSLVCSLDPIHEEEEGGGSDVAGGSWTATDQ